MYAKSFTLTLLGTDTFYTPTLKNQKKTVLKQGDHLSEYFPKGETLSIVSSLIKTENLSSELSSAIPYRADSVAVVNGPSTEGKNVGEKIGIGLGLALNAIVRGHTELNEIAHSRGGVEALLIAHELNAIKEIMATNVTFDQLVEQLRLQQTIRHKSLPFNNTPDIIESLLQQLPQTKDAKNQWLA